MFVAVRIGQAPRHAAVRHAASTSPTTTGSTRPLVVGAALFGVGWGMSGICPGPAISLIAFLPDNLWIFLLAMFVGSYAGGVVIPSGAAAWRLA